MVFFHSHVRQQPDMLWWPVQRQLLFLSTAMSTLDWCSETARFWSSHHGSRPKKDAQLPWCYQVIRRPSSKNRRSQEDSQDAGMSNCRREASFVADARSGSSRISILPVVMIIYPSDKIECFYSKIKMQMPLIYLLFWSHHLLTPNISYREASLMWSWLLETPILLKSFRSLWA